MQQRDTLVQHHQPAADAAAVPATLGKYQLQGELGRGASGIVHKGYDPFVRRHVAVKVAHTGLSVEEGVDGAAADFFAEARAAGMLQHPHIVSLFDAGIEQGFSYLVMEYIDGHTLQPLCSSNGPRAPYETVVDIAFKCAKALDYAHENKVLHRDIKPSNIMMTNAGVPKIMDFSIADINNESQGNSAVGSPLYMAPEQVQKQALGPQSDLYALGGVMFHLLAGEPPFTAGDISQLFRAIVNQPAPRLNVLRPDIPPALADIVQRLLMKDPSERYPTGARLATALGRLFDQLKYSENQVSRRESGDSLRRLHFFHAFSDAEIEEILNASSMRTFQPGETIIAEGEIDNAFYILVLGNAEVRKGDTRLQTLQKGDCFGEIGMLSSLKRSTSVNAATTVLALKVNETQLDHASPRCQLRFYKTFTETLIYRLALASVKLSTLQNIS